MSLVYASHYKNTNQTSPSNYQYPLSLSLKVGFRNLFLLDIILINFVLKRA